jgi:hypothetical protein
MNSRSLSRAVPALGACLVLFAASATAFGQARVPVIEHIEPTSGPPGTEVAIVGRYFVAGTEVRIDTTALQVTELLPNRLTVRVPDGAPTGYVRVQTPGGSQLGPEFRVTAPLPAPRITGVEPSSGPPGSPVTIRGENFSPRLTKNRVSLGGRPVLVRSATPTALEVTVPEAATSGPFEVEVAQAGQARSEQAFTVGAGTQISDFRPRRGGPGSELVLYGTGFSARAEDNRVYLNNVPAKVKKASPTELTVELPRRAASGQVLVDVRGAGRALTPEPFTVQQAPSVVGFSPPAGPAGSLITVHGTGFGSDPAVIEARLGEAPLVVRQAGETRLLLEVPAAKTAVSGRLSIRVAGVGPAWSEGEFAVERVITVDGIAPAQGEAGVQVVVTGSGFEPDRRRNTVRFGRRTAEVLEASATKLVVRAPASGTGPVSVTVGDRVARSAVAFVMTSPPRVRKVVPDAVVVGGELRIYGQGFGENPAVVKVRLAGSELEVRSVRDDAVVVKVLGAPRSGPLEVEVALQGKAVAPGEVRVISELVVGAPAPLSARVGEPVELTGKGFDGTGILVDFGGTPSTPTLVEPGRLKVVVPQGAKSGLVSVRLADGRSAPSPSAFTVLAP